MLPAQPSGAELLKKVDDNAYAASRVAVSEMTIHAGRATRTMKAKSWVRGDQGVVHRVPLS